MGLGESIVVDASVAVKLFVQDEHTPAARQLFALTEHPVVYRAYVPAFFYSECANALWKSVRFADYSVKRAEEQIEDLGDLMLHVSPWHEWLGASFSIAVKYGITAYDASYVALADNLDATLLTCDTKLINSLKNAPFDIQHLSKFSFPPAA